MKERRERILMVTGGRVDSVLLADYVKQSDYLIGVDKGLEALHTLGIVPDLVIGDFDSIHSSIREHYMAQPGAICLNPIKDLTDTHAACLEALKRNPAEILILGGTGSRLDHVFGTIALLKICLDQDVSACIIDGNNRIRMMKHSLTIKRNEQYGNYVSCIPFSERVTGVTLKGFKYNLDSAVLEKADTLGISNEIEQEEGSIQIDTGYLLVMETTD